jgi:mono/diheme cytochrome c family protein
MKLLAIVMMSVGVGVAGPATAGRHRVDHAGPAEAGHYRVEAGPAEAGHYRNQAQGGAVTAAGDATRGKTLFDTTYRCYACHGFAGETGSPRLVPMARTEDSFIAFVRKPRVPAMPAFSDVPAKDLVDLYAYLRSVKSAPPPAESIPLLKDILQDIAARR